jgi:lactate permease
MSTWVQIYDPFHDWRLSMLAAALPIVVLLGLLASGRASAWLSALCGLVAAVLVAVLMFGMPLRLAGAAVCVGLIFALFKIVWLVVTAVFLYDIVVETGQFETMKHSIARLSGDRRLQAILVAFAFGAFIEGAAGFGAPVAISAAFLVGLGFQPFQAALLCLIANTAPVAWGALGTPIKTLGLVSGLDVHLLSVTAGRILPPVSFLVPIWLVCTLAGAGAALEVWPALLVVGGTFAGVQWAWSNYVGVELVDIVSAISSMLAGVLLLTVWKPRRVWRFAHERGDAPEAAGLHSLRAVQVAKAWMPFALLSLVVFTWGLPVVKQALDEHTSWKPEMPGLSRLIAKGGAITGRAQPDEKDYEVVPLSIEPISSTGTAVFLSALMSGGLLGLGPKNLAAIFARTVHRLFPAIVTIFAMLALGSLTRFSGLDAVLGLGFTRVGPWLYPIFGTLLGWLGVALTGSDTSSNVLFGNLQRLTAERLGLNPYLMASANSTGGVMGKMIDAQSIVVAAAATGETGHEARLLRAVLVHSIALALMVAAIVWLYAHVWKTMVPGGLLP